MREAVDLAKAMDARLLLVAAFRPGDRHREPVTSSAAVATVDLREVAEQVLTRAARRAEEEGVDVEFEAHPGDPADVLLDVAIARDVDLIVVGNKGMTGARRYSWWVPNKLIPPRALQRVDRPYGLVEPARLRRLRCPGARRRPVRDTWRRRRPGQIEGTVGHPAAKSAGQWERPRPYRGWVEGGVPSRPVTFSGVPYMAEGVGRVIRV